MSDSTTPSSELPVPRSRVLVVDDEKSIRVSLREFLKDAGYEVSTAEDAGEALEMLVAGDFDVVVTDIILPRTTGVALLKSVKEVSPHVQVILMTGEPTIETASEAVRAGAFDYLSKPIGKEPILRAVANAARLKALDDERRLLVEENRRYQENLEQLVEERTAALRETEARYRAVVEDQTELICRILPDSTITFVNGAYCRYFDRSSEELVGWNSLLLIPEEDRLTVQKHFASLGKDNPVATHEHCVTLSNGEVRWMRWTNRAILDDEGKVVEFQGTGRDITEERLAAERRLLLEAGVNATADGVMITDVRGSIVYINPAYSNLTGYTESEVLGTNPRFLKSGKQDREFYAGLWDTILAGKVWQGELTNKRKDGSEYVEEQQISSVIDASGKVSHFVAVKRDITSRKELEERIERQNEILESTVRERTAELNESVTRLNLANVQLREADVHKTRFLASMSHELRTPLNSIVGFSDILLSGPSDSLDERQRRQVGRISEAGGHLLAMINDLLDMAKVDAGAMELALETVPIVTLIDEIVGMTLGRWQGKTLDVKVFPDFSTPNVRCDIRKIKQVLLNLMSNATKYTSDGGSIEIRAVPFGPNSLKISIIDTGIGIAEEHLTGIFSEFVQADRRRDEAIGGIGLGLALVKRLVELHGGEVGVESAEGLGSTFWFTLPIAASVNGGPSGSRDEERILLSIPAGCRVLVAEDVEANSELIRDILAPYDPVLAFAENGREAVELAKSFTPEVILMDLRMPIMGGLEAVRELRATQGFEKTPIIALSASVGAATEKECFDAGFNAYVGKPVKSVELVNAMSKCLSGLDDDSLRTPPEIERKKDGSTA